MLLKSLAYSIGVNTLFGIVAWIVCLINPNILAMNSVEIAFVIISKGLIYVILIELLELSLAFSYFDYYQVWSVQDKQNFEYH